MDCNVFRQIEKVYHYTSLFSAVQILSSNELKFGELQKMNDFQEAYHRAWFAEKEEITIEDIKAVDRELSKYKQLSFTKDKAPHEGFNISAMWGHYAENGYGVCLVFDKRRLIEGLEKGIIYRDVVYHKSRSENILIPNKQDISGSIEKQRNVIFFRKTRDWSYEQEWRMVVRSESEKYLPIENSLVAVIVNFVKDIDSNESIFNSKSVRLLSEIAHGLPILSYGLWCGKANLCDGAGNEWSKQENWQLDDGQ